MRSQYCQSLLVLTKFGDKIALCRYSIGSNHSSYENGHLATFSLMLLLVCAYSLWDSLLLLNFLALGLL